MTKQEITKLIFVIKATYENTLQDLCGLWDAEKR